MSFRPSQSATWFSGRKVPVWDDTYDSEEIPHRQRWARDHQRYKLEFAEDVLAGVEPIETALFDSLHALQEAESSAEDRRAALSAFASSSETLVRRIEKAGGYFGQMTNEVRKGTMDVVFALASVPPENDGVEPDENRTLHDTTFSALTQDFVKSVRSRITHCVDMSSRDLGRIPREYEVDTVVRMQNGTGQFLFMTRKHRKKLRGHLSGLGASAYEIQRLDREEEAAARHTAAQAHLY